MPVSIFLARLLGPLLLLPGIGLLVNPRAFRTMATEVVGSVTLVYLFGLLDFAAGLASRAAELRRSEEKEIEDQANDRVRKPLSSPLGYRA